MSQDVMTLAAMLWSQDGGRRSSKGQWYGDDHHKYDTIDYGSHDHYWQISDTAVLLPELGSRLKRLKICYREYAEKSLSTAEVVVPNSCVVFLPGCVKDVDLNLFPIQNNFFPVRVGLRRFVVFNKLSYAHTHTFKHITLIHKFRQKNTHTFYSILF